MADREDGFWDRIANIDVPTLILWGSEDRLVPVRLGRRLARTLPRAELVVLPGVGHVPQFEAPEGTRDRILRFLDRI
jgi:pimeloyl-ACP methyl ester carboxylesterase